MLALTSLGRMRMRITSLMTLGWIRIRTLAAFGRLHISSISAVLALPLRCNGCSHRLVRILGLGDSHLRWTSSAASGLRSGGDVCGGNERGGEPCGIVLGGAVLNHWRAAFDPGRDGRGHGHRAFGSWVVGEGGTRVGGGHRRGGVVMRVVAGGVGDAFGGIGGVEDVGRGVVFGGCRWDGSGCG